ncbi:serine/arginine repetitive matrix protein 1-like [Xiphophorus maculatus]|uniref:serine/arginine repetitive matrix protein 1-like n=1 Tax=Xiphophorus maculatus TaxID=8083 RepID=UPI000C6F0111|nr:serine/arginine repetitive matrix protein 1-like [Xiphophorus maculatus]XP_023207516.1 serine/arginine repetitive matrix protein 1-like [Xiphophorus maculatus]
MIGRADIEGSKSDVAMNAWPPQASYPCGVPPQSNSPPATVPGAGHAPRGGGALDAGTESPLQARLPASPDDEAFGYLKRVIVTPAVYPRFIEFLHFDIQSTGQKSHRAPAEDTRPGLTPRPGTARVKGGGRPGRAPQPGRSAGGARRASRVAAANRRPHPPPTHTHTPVRLPDRRRAPPRERKDPSPPTARRAARRSFRRRVVVVGGERVTGRLLPQPRHAPSPASHPSPTDPALRANLYPEVTDLTCRLPLTPFIQHARGCSPWRPAADMGTAWREIYTFSPGFSRASESSPDAAGTATLSRARAPLSGRTHSRAPCPSQRKENSPRGSRQLLRVRLRYRTGRLAAPVSAAPGSGI